MADNSDHSGKQDQSGDAGLGPNVKAELHQLTDVLFDQTITPEQRQRLEQLVMSNAAVAEAYLALVYEWGNLPNYLAPSMVDLDAAGKKTHLSAILQMNETMILPALQAQKFEEEAALPFPQLPPVPAQQPSNRSRWWIALASAAAIGIAVIGGLWMVRSKPVRSPVAVTPVSPEAKQQVAVIPPATITAIAMRTPPKSNPLSIGTTLTEGQLLEVTDGAIELTFAYGASVVVNSPARLHIIDKNALALDDGVLAAHVPPPALGFRVVSPGLLAVDQGTDFGIRTLKDHASSEVHIFGGAVDVSGTDAQGRSSSAPIRAVTGNAFQHTSADAAAPVSIPFAPQNFSRDINAIRVPIPLRNSGEETQAASADAHWIIDSVPDDPNWKSQPAFVVTNPIYSTVVPNSAKCRWISKDAAGPFVAAGIYVFRTSVDLTGLNPATVKIEAIVCADNGIDDVRVNGVSTGLNTAGINTVTLSDFKPKSLQFPTTVWKPGINQVEVIVRNQLASDNTPSQMGLQFQWSGTACALVERKPESPTLPRN